LTNAELEHDLHVVRTLHKWKPLIDGPGETNDTEVIRGVKEVWDIETVQIDDDGGHAADKEGLGWKRSKIFGPSSNLERAIFYELNHIIEIESTNVGRDENRFGDNFAFVATTTSDPRMSDSYEIDRNRGLMPLAALHEASERFDPKLAALARLMYQGRPWRIVVGETKKVAIVVRWPKVIRKDGDGRFHSEFGPAIEFKNGKKVYWWHGTPTTEQIIEHADTITMEQFMLESNVEARRVMWEKIGAERIMEMLHATLIIKDKWGELWEGYLPRPDRPGQGGANGINGIDDLIVRRGPAGSPIFVQRPRFPVGLVPAHLQPFVDRERAREEAPTEIEKATKEIAIASVSKADKRKREREETARKTQEYIKEAHEAAMRIGFQHATSRIQERIVPANARVVKFLKLEDVSTHRIYIHCVPPNIERPRQGLAWMWNLAKEEDYDPDVEA
jgi:hypothetical protein